MIDFRPPVVTSKQFATSVKSISASRQSVKHLRHDMKEQKAVRSIDKDLRSIGSKNVVIGYEYRYASHARHNLAGIPLRLEGYIRE